MSGESLKPDQTNNTCSSRTTCCFGPLVISAIIAGVFTLIVICLMTVNYRTYRSSYLLESDRLIQLKKQVDEDPENEALKISFQDLDLHIRQDYLSRRLQRQRGAYLLLGGIIAFLITMKIALESKKKPPQPKSLQNAPDSQNRNNAASLAVVLIATLLIGGGICLTLNSEIIIDRVAIPSSSTSVPEGIETAAILPDYPSPQQLRENWHRFRGPGGLGISQHPNVPTSWNGLTGQGVLWKSPIPLAGHSSPIVWDDHIFLTAANEDKRALYCFDKNTGSLMWQRAVDPTPANMAEPPEVMEDTGYAASTPVTDGRAVYAIYANGDLASFDFEGNQVWAKNLGLPENLYGYAVSLVMYRNNLLIQYDQGMAEDGVSELIAIDGITGRIAWRKRRPVANSWTTPIIIDSDPPQLITCADPWVIAYQPDTGEEIWRVNCLYGDTAPSPVYARGTVFIVNPNDQLFAIRCDGRGDVTESHIIWTADEGIPDICSPLTDGETTFLLTTYGVLTCYNNVDGTMLWQQELEMNFLASPSLAASHVYLIGDTGVTLIIKPGDTYQEISRLELGEPVSASPAFAEGRIYFRGKNNLYCIGAQ